MNPILLAKIAAIVIAVLAIFFTGEKVSDAKWQAREIELNQKAVEAQNAANAKVAAISASYEQLKATKEANQNTITRNLNNEIKTHASAYACPIPLDGLRLISEATSLANGSAPEPSKPVPKN